MAVSESAAGVLDVIVTSPTVSVATVVLEPAAAELEVGDAGYYTVTLRDVAGNVLTGRTITWTSSASNVASVASGGLVSGLSPGTATITATSEGRSGSATVTVFARPPATGGPVDLCSVIAGGTIVASDNQFLGSLTNRYNAQSVLNEFGQYGSTYSATSIWNEFGQYGSRYSAKSAFNQFASAPPKLVLRGGTTYLWLTVNTASFPSSSSINPYFLRTCSNFP